MVFGHPCPSISVSDSGIGLHLLIMSIFLIVPSTDLACSQFFRLGSVSLTQEAKVDIPSEDNIGPGQALKAGADCQFFLNSQRLSFYGHSEKRRKKIFIFKAEGQKVFWRGIKWNESQGKVCKSR